MKNNLYIFMTESRSVGYGIGTYARELIQCTKSSHYTATLITLMDRKEEEMSVTQKQGVRYINIPGPLYNDSPKKEYDYFSVIPILLAPYINKDENNIFHLNYEQPSLAKALKAHFPGAKFVSTVHYSQWAISLLNTKYSLGKILKKPADQYDPFETSIMDMIDNKRQSLEFCQRIIAISHYTYGNLSNIIGVDTKKLTVVHNTLKDYYRSISSLQRKALQDKFMVDDQQIVITFAGRLDAEKGIYELLDAFKKVLKRHPDCRLFIAGDGDYKPALKGASWAWSKISFTGYLPQKELYNLYRISDIGVAPSVLEEFGYVGLEMMMMGLPVITGAKGGIDEIAEENISGLKVSIGIGKKQRKQSVELLAEKLCYLIEHPKERKQMAVAARKRYKKHFSPQIFRESLLKIYDSLQPNE